MDADARRKPTASHSLPPPPPLFALRARSARVADLAAGVGAAFSGPPDTPPRRSLVTVPFVWEDAPGKPKSSPPPTACNAAAAATAPAAAADAGHVPEGCGAGGEHQDSGDHADLARPKPLKLPPRLQQVPVPPSPSPSPKTVLHGPYHGGGGGCRPPKWVRSGGAALKRTPSAGMALLSRTLSKRRAAGAVAPASGGSGSRSRGGDHHERDAAGPGPDAPWWSPASSSSSSSVSTRFGGDGHAGRGRPSDGREAASSSEEEDGGGSPRASVKITRFTRTRSLPSLTTSNLWASVRRSVKQITPILHGARSWATARYGHW